MALPRCVRGIRSAGPLRVPNDVLPVPGRTVRVRNFQARKRFGRDQSTAARKGLFDLNSERQDVLRTFAASAADWDAKGCVIGNEDQMR